jgi:ligand-binding sensor domain-containing protein
VDHAVQQVEREGSQKTAIEKLFSTILTPCVSGGLNLADRKMELQAIATELRNKEQSSGTAAAEFFPSSVESQMPMESQNSQSVVNKGTPLEALTQEVLTQDNDGRFASGSLQQSGALSEEADIFGKAKRLRKASRQETVTSMKFVPFKLNEDWKNVSGRVWFYITRLFGTDKMVIYNLSSDIEEQAESSKNEGAVTTMHLDSRGLLWSGHRSGAVIAWKEDEKKALCAGARACSCSVRVITTDETGMVWVGSEKGDVRRLGLVSRAGSGGFELQMHRHLRHTGAGIPERSASANIGKKRCSFAVE